MKLERVQSRIGLDTGRGTMPRISNHPGLGAGLNSLANAVGDVASEYEQQRIKLRDFKAQQGFIQLGNDLKLSMLEAEQEMPSDGGGFTESRMVDFGERSTKFLETLPPELQAAYQPRIEALRGDHELKAKRLQFDRQDQFYVDGINDMAERLKNNVLADPDGYEEAKGLLTASIEKTGLRDWQKKKALESATAILQEQALEGLARAGRGEEAAVLGRQWDSERRQATGVSDVQAADLPGVAQTLLRTISKPGIEGANYNTLYGGGTFEGFEDHPRQAKKITSGPNKGKTTTAAGRYQFLAGTWDEAAKALGLQDFSPASQDKAAWWLAQRDYKRRTGGDLAADLTEGNFDKVRAGLAGKGNDTTWEGLKAFSGAQFAQIMTSDKGAADASQFDWAKYRIGGATREDSFSGMKPQMQTNLAAFLQASDRELGEGMQVYSGYRSEEKQGELYQAALKKYGSADRARKWVAPPGNSKHNSGEAADLKFKGVRIDKIEDPAVKNWIKENAPKYGLTVRMEWEPWQVELAGKPEKTNSVSVLSAVEDAQGLGRWEQFAQKAIARADAAQNSNSLAAYGEYDLSIANGEVPSVEEINENPLLKDAHKAVLVRKINAANAELIETNRFRNLIEGGGINPFNKEHQKGVDKLYQSYTANSMGIKDSDPEKRQKAARVLTSFVKDTGIVPSPAIENIRQLQNSSDPELVEEALWLSGYLTTNHEQALSDRKGGADLIKAGREFNFSVNRLGLDPAKAAERFMFRQTSEFRNERDRREKLLTGKDGYLGKISEADLGDMFDPGLLGGDPEIGFTDGQRLSIVSDYKDAVKEHFLDTGDWELSNYLASQDLTGPTGLYGVSEINGDRTLMRYPPEKVYANYLRSGGTIDEIAIVASREISDALGVEVPREDIGFVVDAEAEAAIKTGQPKYRVVARVKGKDGQPYLQMLPAYFRFDEAAGRDYRSMQTEMKRSGIREVIDADGDKVIAEIKTGKLMQWDSEAGAFNETGASYKFPKSDIKQYLNVDGGTTRMDGFKTLDDIAEEERRRAEFLEPTGQWQQNQWGPEGQ